MRKNEYLIECVLAVILTNSNGCEDREAGKERDGGGERERERKE